MHVNGQIVHYYRALLLWLIETVAYDVETRGMTIYVRRLCFDWSLCMHVAIFGVDCISSLLALTP